jgi:DNA-binding NarL/FixJ family response regulator
MPVQSDVLRVLVIVRQPLLANVLSESLHDEGLNVVGNCRCVTEADLGVLRPDVILIDIDTCARNVSKTLHICREQSPETRICVLVSDAEDPQLRYCVQERVEGCIVTDMPFENIVIAVRAVAQGGAFIDRRISRHLLTHRKPLSQQDLLSAREEEVVRMVVRGLANKEIARDLKLSQSTVKNHISRIFDKLSVTSRTEAAVLAVKVGLI